MNDLIEINPDICGGHPVVRGTRIPVRQLQELWRQGATVQELLNDYPAIDLHTLLALIQPT